MSDQEQPETGNADDNAAREKNIARFEKLFRLMDSSEIGEAQAAFRSAHAILPKINLTFAEMLEMMGNSGGSNDAELLEVIEQYKVANAELKAAEDLIIAENERMNFLLRNYRDTPFVGKNMNPKAFKAELTGLGSSFTAFNNGAAKDLPANADELEKYYNTRIAEALGPQQGHAARNGYQRMLLWLIKKSGQDTSLEGVLAAQDLVVAQQAVIKEQADLLKQVMELRETSAAINDKLDVLVSASGTPEEYAEALEHLKQAQLLLGDSQTIESFMEKNRVLEEEIKQLEHKLGVKDKDISSLSESLAAEKAKPPTHVFVDDNGNLKDSSVIAEAQLKLSTYAEKLETSIASPISSASADQIAIQVLENEVDAQRNEVQLLQQKLVPAAIDNVLSADDIAALRKLERYAPVLEQSLKDLEDIRAALEETTQQPSNGLFGFLKRRGKTKKEMRSLQNKMKQIETISQSFDQACKAVSTLEARLDAKLDEAQKAIVKDVAERVTAETTRRQGILDTQHKDLKEKVNKLASDYTGRLDEARKTYEGTVKKIEDSLAVDSGYFLEHQKQRLAIQAEIEDGLAKHLAAKGQPADNEETREIRQKALDSLLVKAYGDNDKMTHLLSKGADIEASFTAKSGGTSTLLAFAIDTENDAMVRFLVGKGADIFAPSNGLTALERIHGHRWEKSQRFQSILDIVATAVPSVPVPKKRSEVDKSQTQLALNSLMHLAYVNNEGNTFKNLIAKGADINSLLPKGSTVLMDAILNKKWDWADIIVAANPNPQTVDNNGATIYTHVTTKPFQNRSDLQRAMALLDKLTPDAPAPKPVVVTYDEGMRAFANAQLVMAFNSNDINMCKLAIEKGADVNVPINNDKQTMLMAGIKNENVDMFNFIAAQKPNVMLRDAFNKTALDYAQKSWQNNRARLAITETLLKIIPNAPV